MREFCQRCEPSSNALTRRDPDKVLMQIIDTMLPILTGAMRSTVTGLLDEAYARGVADERARVVAKLEALHAESLTLPLPQDYVDGIECAVDHLKEET